MKRSLLILCVAILACGTNEEDESPNSYLAESEGTETSVSGGETTTEDAGSDITEAVELEAPPCDREDGVCTVVIPTSFGPGFRISELAIGADGTTSQALNIDPENGEEDCNPPGKCDGGGDNALSSLGGFANDGLGDALANGKLMILGTIIGDIDDTFTIEMYSGTPNDESCAFESETCSYDISASSYDCQCGLRASMEGTLNEGKLIAGGDNATFKFTFPIDDVTLDLTAVRARMIADAELTEEGGLILSNVLIGGSIKQSTLIDTINEHPGETLGPISKTTIIQVIETIAPDIDTDEDGIDDGLSVGLTGAAIPANFTGDLLD